MPQEKGLKKRKKAMVTQGQPMVETVIKPLNVPRCNSNGHTDEIKIGDSYENHLHPSHLSVKNYQKIVKLTDEKCLISCFFQGTKIQALLDTGVLVPIISKSTLNDNFPKIVIRDMSELLGSEAALDLKTANGSTLPYSGYVVLSFSLQEGT